MSPLRAASEVIVDLHPSASDANHASELAGLIEGLWDRGVVLMNTTEYIRSAVFLATIWPVAGVLMGILVDNL